MKCHIQPNMKPQPPLTPDIRIRIPGVKHHRHGCPLVPCPMFFSPSSLKEEGTFVALSEQKLNG